MVSAAFVAPVDITCQWMQSTQLPPQWNALNARSGFCPVLDAATIAILRKHYAQMEQVWTCYDEQGHLIAATILIGGLLKTSYLPMNQPLGLWVQNPDYPFEQLLAALVRDSGALMVSIMQIDPDRLRRPQGSPRLELVECMETARITTTGTFDQYWNARGINLRANNKKRRHKLEKAQITPRLEIVSTPLKIGAAVDQYGLLESKGWKAKAGTAVHPDNVQGRYYRDLFEVLARHQCASVWQYWYGDRLVASDLCVHNDSGLFIVLKTAYDESESATSPSQLMRQEMFSALWRDGTAVIEFYGRVMEWHRKWCTEFRSMYHVNAFRWAWLRAVRAGVKKLKARSAPA